ncbi:MAG: hypothetical protein D6813_09815, partial [Calditrichaeota bacterium]
KLGDEAVDSLVELINQSLGEQKNNIIELVEEKFERRLTQELSKIQKQILETERKLEKQILGVKTGLEKQIQEVKTELRNEIQEVKSGLEDRITKVEVQMSKNYASIITWMFIFWIGQVGVILGILFAFFK